MNSKIVIHFEDNTSTGIWAGEIRHFSIIGCVLEMEIEPIDDNLLITYCRYKYKKVITGVEIWTRRYDK